MVSMTDIKSAATKVLQLHGRHAPMLLLVIDNNLIEIPLQGILGDTTTKVKLMFGAGKQVRQQLRANKVPDDLPVTSVNMIVEAWMVSRQKGEPRVNVAPSQHPNRIEVLMITRYEPATDLHEAAVFQIVRKPDGSFDTLADRRENHDRNVTVYNPQLAAFYAGLEGSDGLYRQVLDSMEAAARSLRETGDIPKNPPDTPLQ